MEKDIRSEDAPYIVKSPWMCDYMEEILQSPKYVIDHAYIPIRDLFSASASRIYVSQNAKINKLSLNAVPGGLWDTTDPSRQEDILSRQLYKLIYSLTKYDVSTSLLFFPRFVHDPIYLYKKLNFLLNTINYDNFLKSFNKTVKPELVHEFSEDLEQLVIRSKSIQT